MTGLVKKAVLGAAMAASALATATPAAAQYRGGYGYRHHGGIGAGGAAVLGGLVGLGVGAAIASSSNHNRYYDRGYYYGPGPRGYYYDDYRYNDYRYNEYQPRCFYERRYDQYNGRPYDVRICR